METKEIKINIPKGYEIDKENSTFECIKFKPSKKYFTYKDICAKLFKEESPGYYVDPNGRVQVTRAEAFITDPINAPSKKQLERLIALNQLMNIAYYYNGNQYLREGYYIGYDRLEDKYSVNSLGDGSFEPAGIAAMFMYAIDAKAVINNPNFRSILDTLCK